IGNAMKYRSEKTPEITISAADEGSQWHVAVTDNGVGVPAGDRERIFGLFKRGQSQVPGSGVGLAICKRIVTRHGGRIWIESEPGQGSTFHFTLSKSFPAVREQAV
ncbi:MAG TPA: ATP-binding protein, partial [Bryobacteraceae bacterium]|nr:ATP-binding protein [Bryobacteraceae bacterium]